MAASIETNGQHVKLQPIRKMAASIQNVDRYTVAVAVQNSSRYVTGCQCVKWLP